MQKDIKESRIKKIEIKKPAPKVAQQPKEPAKIQAPPVTPIQPKEAALPQPAQQMPPSNTKTPERIPDQKPMTNQTLNPNTEKAVTETNQLTKQNQQETITKINNSKESDPYRESI